MSIVFTIKNKKTAYIFFQLFDVSIWILKVLSAT